MVAKNMKGAVGILHVLSLVGLCVGFGCSNASFFEAEVSRTSRVSGEGHEVRVVSWNMERVGEPGSMEYEALHAVLVHLNADVVGLNEVAGADEVAYLEELAADLGYDVVFGADAAPEFGYQRNAILSRFPMVDSAALGSVELSGDDGANDLTRPLLRAEFEVAEGARFTAIVGHWKSGSGNDNEFRRTVASRRAVQALEERDSFWDAVVVMGDMNAELDESESPDHFYEDPDGLPASFSVGSDVEGWLELGLANDPFSPLLGFDLEPLALTQSDGQDGTRPESGRRLDYLWVSQAIASQPMEGEVYTCGAPSDDEATGLFHVRLDESICTWASDHLPVVADLVIGVSEVPERVVTPVVPLDREVIPWDREVLPEPTPAGDWKITEVLPNPDLCSDNFGEWVEVYNSSEGPLSLAGLFLEDAYGHRAEVEGGEIAAGAYAVLGRSDAERFCGDMQPDGYYATVMSLNNTGDSVLLGQGEDILDAPVAYGGELVEPGLALVVSADGTGWCEADPTPGRPNVACD